VEELCETAEEQSVSREALSLDISRLVARVVAGEPIDTAERGAALAAKYPDLGMSGALIGQAIDRAVGMVGMIRSAPRPARRSKESAEQSPIVTPAAILLVDEPPGASSPLPPNGGFAESAQVVLPPAEALGRTEVSALSEDVSAPSEMAEGSAAPSLTSTIEPTARSIDDSVAVAIDAEIGNLVSDETTTSAASPASAAPATRLVVPAEPEADPADALPGWANGESHIPPPEIGQVRATKPHAATPGSIFSSFRRALFGD